MFSAPVAAPLAVHHPIWALQSATAFGSYNLVSTAQWQPVYGYAAAQPPNSFLLASAAVAGQGHAINASVVGSPVQVAFSNGTYVSMPHMNQVDTPRG
jgi:hypothetical protein